MQYFTNRKDAARFVAKLLKNLPDDSRWTITIEPGKSEGFYVSTAITRSSDVIQIMDYLKERQNT